MPKIRRTYKPSRVGVMFRAEREQRCLTTRQLADASGVPRSTINNLEIGTVQRPPLDVVLALCVGLGIKPYDFILRYYQEEETNV